MLDLKTENFHKSEITVEEVSFLHRYAVFVCVFLHICTFHEIENICLFTKHLDRVFSKDGVLQIDAK